MAYHEAWKQEAHPTHIKIWGHHSETGPRLIAEIPYHGGLLPQLYATEEDKANARLIAYTPKLLQLLQAMANSCFQHQHDRNVGPDYSAAYRNMGAMIRPYLDEVEGRV